MRKIFAIFAVLLGFAMHISAQAAPITAPDADKEYFVKHSSGYLLTFTGSTLQINTPGSGESQAFTFEPIEGAPGHYAIKTPSGKYIGSDSGYSVKLFDDCSDTYAQFTIEVSYLPDWTVLRNVGRGACLGSDNNQAGGGVYTDKGGNDGKHLWVLVEKGGAYTGLLENTLANAQSLADNAVAGTAVGNYPQSAIDALIAAIATAQGALASDSQEEVNAANDALAAAVSAFRSTQVVMFVDPAKQYLLKQKATGMVMAIDSKPKAVVQELDGSDNQKFALVHVDGTDYTYNLQLADGESYLITSGNWDTSVGTDPTQNAAQFKFTLAELTDAGVAYYNIRGTKGLLGSDNTSNGSTVYSNKGDGSNARWALEEVVEGSVITDALAAAITLAQSTLAKASIGDGPNQYPQAAADALMAAIATAQAMLDNPTTQSEVNEVTTALNNAINAFNAAKIIFSTDVNKQYYIVQEASSLVLAVNSSNVGCIEMPSGSDNQKFRIIPAMEGSSSLFNLQLADGESYLIRKGGWDTTVGTDPTAEVAIFEFEIASLTNGTYLIKKYNEGGYLGSDSTEPGSWVYTNKGNNSQGRWTIVEVVEGQLLTAALDKSIAQAEALLADAVVGDQPWCWPQEAVDALAAALAAAKGATPATQADVNDIATALADAIKAFQNAQIEPYFQPEEGVTYRFSILKYDTKFLTNNEGSASTTANYTAGNEGQHWTFQEVEGTNHAYIVKNQGMALNYDGSVTEMADADAPLWRTVYIGNIDYIDRFALVENDDPTKVVTFSSGNTFAIQTLSKTNNAHQGRFYRVDPVYDANLGQLEYAIARAESKLAGVDRGNEIGQWSDAKCEAMQAMIDKAKTYYSGKTQEEVNAMYTELTNYVAEFLANPNTVIKDELEAQLARGRQAADAAEIGIEPGQYLWSEINAFVAALAQYESQAKNVTEQDACDALAQEVKDFVDAFTGHETAQEVAVVLNDAIACAQEVYEAEKDNVGTDKGQRPQDVIDAFLSAINAAKAATEPTVADLQALLDAYNAFINGSISVDRTALRNAIAAAQAEKYSNLVAGEFNGQYSQEAIDNFTAALANAIAVEADMTKTQEEVNAAATALNNARNALDKAKVTISFAALDADIAKAEALLAGVTLVGEGEGACPQDKYDAFTAAIAAAKAIERDAISQASVDQLDADLKAAIMQFDQAVREAVGLEALISEVEEVLDAAVAGFKPGNYPSTAIAALNQALAAAQSALASTTSSQADLLAARAALSEALATFYTQAIPAHDLTELEALVAQAEAYMAETGDNNLNLLMALDAAKDVIDNPNDYTKNQVTTITNDLKKALENSGLIGIAADGSVIGVANGRLLLSDGCSASVYTVDGRLVATSAGQSIALAPGTYAIAIEGNGISMRKVVRVK